MVFLKHLSLLIDFKIRYLCLYSLSSSYQLSFCCTYQFPATIFLTLLLLYDQISPPLIQTLVNNTNINCFYTQQNTSPTYDRTFYHNIILIDDVLPIFLLLLSSWLSVSPALRMYRKVKLCQ